MTKGKAKMLSKLLQQSGCYELIREAIGVYEDRDMSAEDIAICTTHVIQQLEHRYRGIIGVEEPVVRNVDLEESIVEIKRQIQEREDEMLNPYDDMPGQ